ncbi:MAG TPA: hypothetical protein PLF40_00075 [Kofleriaceae bacterium]|nr:hypothetical protein [Kofleriaceae bacterium]
MRRFLPRVSRGLCAALTVAGLAVATASCGGAPPIPKRGVVETDLGGWKFRRFQPVLDVEVWVPDNPAEAFTASYVRDEAEKRGSIRDNDLANAFVTRYAQPDGVLRETVKFARRLAKESGYQVEEQTIEGVRVFRITGNGETWALWAAKKYVVKVGGRGRDSIPGDLVEAYGDRYNSKLAGGMLEGPLPPGPEPKKQDGSGAEPYDENNPKPDWETYDPKKAAPAINGPARATRGEGESSGSATGEGTGKFPGNAGPKTETAPSELPLPDGDSNAPVKPSKPVKKPK